MNLAPAMSRRTPIAVIQRREQRARQLALQLQRSDLNHAQVAAMVGVSAKRISRWANGGQPIPEARWTRLQEVLA